MSESIETLRKALWYAEREPGRGAPWLKDLSAAIDELERFRATRPDWVSREDYDRAAAELVAEKTRREAAEKAVLEKHGELSTSLLVKAIALGQRAEKAEAALAKSQKYVELGAQRHAETSARADLAEAACAQYREALGAAYDTFRDLKHYQGAGQVVYPPPTWVQIALKKMEEALANPSGQEFLDRLRRAAIDENRACHLIAAAVYDGRPGNTLAQSAVRPIIERIRERGVGLRRQTPGFASPVDGSSPSPAFADVEAERDQLRARLVEVEKMALDRLYALDAEAKMRHELQARVGVLEEALRGFVNGGDKDAFWANNRNTVYLRARDALAPPTAPAETVFYKADSHRVGTGCLGGCASSAEHENYVRGIDWRDDGDMLKFYAAEYIATAIRALAKK